MATETRAAATLIFFEGSNRERPDLAQESPYLTAARCALAALALFYASDVLAHQPLVSASEKQYARWVADRANCYGCHAFAEERIGPAFMDMADRYRNDPQGALPFLTQKIKWGGEGNWGGAHMPRQCATPA